MVLAGVFSMSRMRNLRATAMSAIRTTVRTWMMLALRATTLRMECLNSRAMSRVMIMPKMAWKTDFSAGFTTPSISRTATLKMRLIRAATMITAITAVKTRATTSSNFS